MWNPVPYTLKANTETEYPVQNASANCIYIVNNSNFSIYIDLYKANPSNYEEMAIPQGKALIIRKNHINTVKLYATGDANIIIHEIHEADPRIMMILQNIQGQINIASTVGLKAGELLIDAQKHIHVDIESAPDPTPWTWIKITAGGAGNQNIKASPGKIGKIQAEGAITVYPLDNSIQAWASGNSFDFGPNGLNCITDIKLNFSGAGVAWVAYK